MTKSLFQEDGSLFRSTDDGKELFYPWAYPGDALLISKRQKTYLSLYIFLVGTTVGVGFLALILANAFNLITSEVMDYLVSGISIASVISYLFIVFCLRKHSADVVCHTSSDSEKKVPAVWMVLVLHIFIILSAMSDDPELTISHVLFIFVNISFIIFLLCLGWVIRQKNGFLFQRDL